MSKDTMTTTQGHAATSDIRKEASAVMTTEAHPGSDVPSRPPGTTPFGRTKSTVAQGIQDLAVPPVPSEPTQTPTAGPSDSQAPDPPPVNPAIPNLRLERAMANAEKKRKADGKTMATTSKKQKTATKPTRTITIKNICMHQWNEQQPGGQGLAADFDTYFKRLSDADKEPFKMEMRTAQAVVRKTKTTSKKPSETPLIN
ncbi:hypothetical protein EDB87DRAFT_1687567 [Lactarius vividus]|nr:hypothetical protein EDB87DRAFT_1687567 [Lactarius vividus]